MNKSFFLIGVCAVVINSVSGYDNYNCADFGAWQAGCAGPGTVACEVPYASGGYCIAKCYSNTCSNAEDALQGFKNFVCGTHNYAADIVRLGSGEISLAIHRYKNSGCGSYHSTTFNSVPYDRQYSEGPTHDRIPK